MSSDACKNLQVIESYFENTLTHEYPISIINIDTLKNLDKFKNDWISSTRAFRVKLPDFFDSNYRVEGPFVKFGSEIDLKDNRFIILVQRVENVKRLNFDYRIIKQTENYDETWNLRFKFKCIGGEVFVIHQKIEYVEVTKKLGTKEVISKTNIRVRGAILDNKFAKLLPLTCLVEDSAIVSNKLVEKKHLFDIIRKVLKVDARNSSTNKILNTHLNIEKNASDRRQMLVVDQNFGTGKTTRVMKELTDQNYIPIHYPVKNGTDRIDDLFNIYKLVNKHAKDFMIRLESFYICVFSIIGNKSLYIYTIISSLGLFYGFEKLSRLVVKSSRTWLNATIYNILKQNESLLLVGMLLLSIIIVCLYFPYIMKLFKQDSSIYSDFLSELIARTLTHDKRVLVVEDSDRLTPNRFNSLIATIESISGDLTELGSDKTRIILNWDSKRAEELFNDMESFKKSSTFYDFQSKYVYDTINFNNSLVENVYEFLFKNLSDLDENNASNFKDKVSHLKSSNHISIRDLHLLYRQAIGDVS